MTEHHDELQSEDVPMMVSAELLSSKESQGMHVGVEANQAKGSGTSPKPAAGMKLGLEPFPSSGFFPLLPLSFFPFL